MEDIDELIKVTKAQSDAQYKITSSLESIDDSLKSVRDELKAIRQDHDTQLKCFDNGFSKLDKTLIKQNMNFRLFIYIAGGIFAAVLGALAKHIFF